MATWLVVAQIAMAVVGVGLIFVGSVSLGRFWEIRRPLPALAGLVLLLPLLVCQGVENVSSKSQNLSLLNMTATGAGLGTGLVLLLVGIRRRFEESLLVNKKPPLARVAEAPPAIYTPLETLSTRPQIPSKVRCYPGRADLIPPEVQALGHAKQVHKPLRSLARLRQKPRTLMFLGVMLLCGALGVLLPFHEEPIALGGGILAAVVGSVCLLAACFPLPVTPTYIVHRDALLVVLKNDFIIVPWKAVAEVHPTRGITTLEDGRIKLNPHVQDWPQLVEKVQQYVAVEQQARTAEQLARIRAQVASGVSAVFGPFEVNKAMLCCESQTVLWDQVTQVTVQPGEQSPTVEIRTQDSLWCRRPLNFPNDFIFLEMLKRLCQPSVVFNGV